MRYFDSPKNRALWEREMKELRAERERGEQKGFVPEAAEQKVREVKNVYRRKISLKELERQELAVSGKSREHTSVRMRTQMKKREKAMQTPHRSL